jgi:hypothetical protein
LIALQRALVLVLIVAFTPAAHAASPSPHVNCCWNYGEDVRPNIPVNDLPPHCRAFDLKRKLAPLLEQFRANSLRETQLPPARQSRCADIGRRTELFDQVTSGRSGRGQSERRFDEGLSKSQRDSGRLYRLSGCVAPAERCVDFV